MSFMSVFQLAESKGVHIGAFVCSAVPGIGELCAFLRSLVSQPRSTP
eukprot:SAG31_NODE_38087_length_299_cov_0.735000_1_plen_46_part_01